MSGPSQFEVLVGGHVEAGDGRGHDVLHTWPDTDGKTEVIDWCLDNLVAEDTLELVQKCFALLAVEFAGLVAEEVVHLRQRAVGKRAVFRYERLEPRGRVAGDAADGQHYPAQLLLAPRSHERAALCRPHLCTDADRRQPPLDGLTHCIVGWKGCELTAIEAVWIPCFGQ